MVARVLPSRTWMIAAGYAMVAGAGAMVSHWVTHEEGALGVDRPMLHRMFDLGFVAVTTGLLYLVLSRHTRSVERAAFARAEAARLAEANPLPDGAPEGSTGAALCNAVRRVSGASRVAYFRLDQAARTLSLCDAYGFPQDRIEQVRDRLVFHEDDPEDVVGDVTKTRRARYVPDTSAEPRWRHVNPVLRSAFLAPVAFGDRLFGVITAFSEAVDGIPPDRQDLIASFAVDAGTSLELRRRLAATQEALASLRAAQDRLVRQERLRALGVLASGVAHDFNNALTPILGYAELLLEPGALDRPDRVRRQLESIRTAGRDAGAIVSRLREFYRERVGTPAPVSVDLHALATEVAELTAPRVRDADMKEAKTVTVRTEDRGAPPVVVDPAQLREALVNLVFNAVDAIAGAGHVILRSRPDGAGAMLEVVDDGAGMSEDVRRRAAEPFFTTKGERGTGMGLMMVRQTVESSGGAFEIESAPGVGTTIRLRFAAPAAVGAE